MSYILDLLCVKLQLTPKYHAEISGRGIEYSWGYLKLHFHCDFNDAVASRLKGHVVKLLDRSVITINRARKFTRKAREYKLTYSLMIHMADRRDTSTTKGKIVCIMKLFKCTDLQWMLTMVLSRRHEIVEITQ